MLNPGGMPEPVRQIPGPGRLPAPGQVEPPDSGECVHAQLPVHTQQVAGLGQVQLLCGGISRSKIIFGRPKIVFSRSK